MISSEPFSEEWIQKRIKRLNRSDDISSGLHEIFNDVGKKDKQQQLKKVLQYFANLDAWRWEDALRILEIGNPGKEEEIREIMKLSEIECKRIALSGPDGEVDGSLVNPTGLCILAMEKGYKIHPDLLAPLAKVGERRVKKNEKKAAAHAQAAKEAEEEIEELEEWQAEFEQLQIENNKLKTEIAKQRSKPKRNSKRHEESNRHIPLIRAAAKKRWKEDPQIKIKNMGYEDEIISAAGGKIYSDSFYRKHLKDLAPDNSPGRPPKRK